MVDLEWIRTKKEKCKMFTSNQSSKDDLNDPSMDYIVLNVRYFL